MSDDMTAEAAFVPGYAGHADQVARRVSDQQVRAWVGEMLVDLEDRLPLDGVREQVDALLLRCEFADQHVIRAIEQEQFGAAGVAAAIEVYDRNVITAARTCSTAAAADLAASLTALERAFDERAAAIEAQLKLKG